MVASPIQQPDRRESSVAVVVSCADGVVVDLNRQAERLVGAGRGTSCWELVGRAVSGDTVPCCPGCVARLIDAGAEHAAVWSVVVGRKRYQLTCVPVDGHAISTLTALEPGEEVDEAPLSERLTVREVQVLQHLARGLTTRQTAGALGISSATVRTHVENMRRKLSVATQAAVVAEGFRRGYLR
jgi:DNA-binding CsgD family transcriptional regulator